MEFRQTPTSVHVHNTYTQKDWIISLSVSSSTSVAQSGGVSSSTTTGTTSLRAGKSSLYECTRYLAATLPLMSKQHKSLSRMMTVRYVMDTQLHYMILF